MWNDNETELDLINVAHLKWAVSATLSNSGMLPVTIGVFGDWGSGKTSLLRLVQRELSEKEDCLCLWFNGWLFEGYEDAKAALLGTIVEEIQNNRALTEKAKKLTQRLLRRIDWFSVMGLVGKGALSLALGVSGLQDAAAISTIQAVAGTLPNVVKRQDAPATEDHPSPDAIRNEIRRFRDDFAELLSETKIKTLVVFIDDLDRCLPETTVSTLEALRLFVSVPNSAFVIAADEKLVELAVRTRYGQESSGIRDVARDYLEKLVQVPVRIPPLSHDDVTAYVSLLFVQLHMADRIEEVTKKLLEEQGQNQSESFEFDFSWLKTNFESIPVALEGDFALAMQIGNLLAEQLRGNPRQIKRFLNTLVLRLGMSEQRGVKLERRVLAKLMILEYSARSQYEKLAELQGTQGGKTRELEVLQKKADQTNGGKDKSTKSGRAESKHDEPAKLDPEIEKWLEDDWMKTWIKAEPLLAGVDLRPYFYISRESSRLAGIGRIELSPKARSVAEALASGSEIKVKQGLQLLKSLSPQDISVITEILCRQARESETHSGPASLAAVLIAVVNERPELARGVISTLRALPDKTLSAGIPLLTAGLKKVAPRFAGEVDGLLESWSKSTTNKQLAGAAVNAMKKKL